MYNCSEPYVPPVQNCSWENVCNSYDWRGNCSNYTWEYICDGNYSNCSYREYCNSIDYNGNCNSSYWNYECGGNHTNNSCAWTNFSIPQTHIATTLLRVLTHSQGFAEGLSTLGTAPTLHGHTNAFSGITKTIHALYIRETNSRGTILLLSAHNPTIAVSGTTMGAVTNMANGLIARTPDLLLRNVTGKASAQRTIGMAIALITRYSISAMETTPAALTESNASLGIITETAIPLHGITNAQNIADGLDNVLCGTSGAAVMILKQNGIAVLTKQQHGLIRAAKLSDIALPFMESARNISTIKIAPIRHIRMTVWEGMTKTAHACCTTKSKLATKLLLQIVPRFMAVFSGHHLVALGVTGCSTAVSL
ncbi:hypothetical protein FGO68_gene5310 [Halteria grandinella]|uniref:Uncharacterized protein n=1 Tax=Halteria grandinella TaxID=5974 RepID=A0A8J8N9W8_HALGN|nr:hypothetical protein FGO68_gene5310 [Halteria grandinella]